LGALCILRVFAVNLVLVTRLSFLRFAEFRPFSSWIGTSSPTSAEEAIPALGM